MDNTAGSPAADDHPLTDEAPFEVIPESECWMLLRSLDVGRLAMSTDDCSVEIFPINFVVDHGTRQPSLPAGWILWRTIRLTPRMTCGAAAPVPATSVSQAESEAERDALSAVKSRNAIRPKSLRCATWHGSR